MHLQINHLSSLPEVEHLKIAVIGLGYVGLPLAVALAKYYNVVGYDTSKKRIEELKSRIDCTNELSANEIEPLDRKLLTQNICDLDDCNFYIVTVPTPIDESKCPDLTPLKEASEQIGRFLKKGNIVVFESTVFPGATEDICVPLLEKNSGLKFNIDFFVGYSPERMNPGENQKKLTDIVKITSGSNEETAQLIDKVYARIVKAGTHPVSSIKIAEASKIIENIQRDVNIALVNEFAMLFNEMNLDTHEIIEAAKTKWNFLQFQPGLVGGHCIGVDPYYLTHKARSIGFHPELISAGRRINDSMSIFVANKILKALLNREIVVQSARIVVLGFSFKENCSDIRNTKVIDLVQELAEVVDRVDIYDPLVNPESAYEEYGILTTQNLPNEKYQAAILVVPHKKILNLNINDLKRLLTKDGFIYDFKGVLAPEACIQRL